MKKTTVVYIFVLALAFAPGRVLYAEDTLIEGFEAENYWEETDWENTAQVIFEAAPINASEGNNSLKVIIREEATDWKNKVAFFKETGGIDLSGGKSVVMDIYNPESTGIEAAVGFRTGKDWTYYESHRKPAGKGWNRDVAFNLEAGDYKCKSTDWRYETQIADSNDVKEFYVLIYRPARMAQDTVYIDNIRVR